ncbi:MAG: LysR family transcriptional regulator [Gammaproteobacteria bacterium]|nr:LysR family transcriptional regulator [Gammaproteobacteria bacterium]
MQKSFSWDAVSFDWNQVRAFLAAVEQGSLSGAARVLGQTQPTVSRQISSLEDQLGVLLLERGTRGLTITDSGQGLLAHVTAMGQAALKLSLAASGQSAAIEGDVCITATNAFATFHLPRILKRIRMEAPLVTTKIITSNDLQDITKREADISIRHAAPTEPDLIGRHVGDMDALLYASREYLDQHGRPETAEDCAKYDFVGFENPATLIAPLQAFGVNVSEKNFKINTASGTAILEFVRQGLGVSILTRDAQYFFPDLEPVLPDLGSLPVPIWLVTHRELRTSGRIRVVFDILSEEIGNLQATSKRPATATT